MTTITEVKNQAVAKGRGHVCDLKRKVYMVKLRNGKIVHVNKALYTSIDVPVRKNI